MLPPILVINLDRDVKRLESIRQRLREHEDEDEDEQIHIIRVPGVYGKTLSRSERASQTTPFCDSFCTPTMIGCFLSHRRCWQIIVERGWECAIVLEDDARPVPGFRSVVERAMEEVPGDYHVLLLGCMMCRPIPDKPVLGLSDLFNAFGSRRSRWISPHIRVPGFWAGTHGMIVSQAGARWCLERWPRAEYHIDVMMRGERELKVYSTAFPIVNQKTWVGKSDSDSQSDSNDGGDEVSHNTGRGDWIVRATDRVSLGDGLSLGFALGMPVVSVLSFPILVWHLIVIGLVLLYILVWSGTR